MTPRGRFQPPLATPPALSGSTARNLSCPFELVLLIAALTLIIVSCGGGGGASVVRPPPAPGPLSFSVTSLPDGVAGQSYNRTLGASGGTPPYAWSLGPGSDPLPQGLTLSTTGVVSGTPADPPTTPFDSRLNIQVRDSAGSILAGIFSLRIFGLLKIVTASVPDGNIGQSYGASIVADGGILPYSWSLSAGSLPSGTSYNSSSQILGTPTNFGDFSFTVRVQDSSPQPQVMTRVYTLHVDNHLVIATPTLPFGVVGQPYREFMQAAGGVPPYVWSQAMGGAIPPGLTMVSTGELSGTPTQASTAIFFVQVTDSAVPPATVTGPISTFFRPPLSILNSSIGDGVRNRQYDFHVRADGGRPPLSMSVTSGSLPQGLNLLTLDASNGIFSIFGTPTALGTFGFTLQVQDSSTPPAASSTAFSMRISEPLVITTTGLPDGLTGTPYFSTLTATGGIQPYNWTLFSTLPSGLTLNNATGVISGTASAEYSPSLFVVIFDSSSPQQTHSVLVPFRIIGQLKIETTLLPPLRAGESIRIAPSFTGGVAPYTWSVSSGTLPAGLTLDSQTGVISGTPSVAGQASITLTLSDSGTSFPQTVNQSLLFDVRTTLGRNDSIATATPLSNGTYPASLSPLDGPPAGSAAPDVDYYMLTGLVGSIVTLEIVADRLVPNSPMDSVIEIVDSAGARLASCNTSNVGLTLPCLNDDISGTTDSKLFFQISGAAGVTATFYVRVFDWAGNARPDFRYEIKVSGAN